MVPSIRCPCGTGLPYAECCAPLHAGHTPAATAEQLMRSRYSAFAVGDRPYLLATWHSTTRPEVVTIDPQLHWTGLRILDTSDGGLLAAEGTVEFRADYERDGRAGALSERSRFVREQGAWRYLDGVSGG